MFAKPVELKRDHLRMIEILAEVGMAKNTARVLTFIAVAGRTFSAQIQSGTGMRQPEVSIALKELSDRKWISRQSFQREGKGRPIYVYRLRKEIGEIVEAVEREQDRRVRQIQKDKEDLRQIAARLAPRE
jgi:predicted transcriptional regulator